MLCLQPGLALLLLLQGSSVLLLWQVCCFAFPPLSDRLHSHPRSNSDPALLTPFRRIALSSMLKLTPRTSLQLRALSLLSLSWDNTSSSTHCLPTTAHPKSTGSASNQAHLYYSTTLNLWKILLIDQNSPTPLNLALRFFSV